MEIPHAFEEFCIFAILVIRRCRGYVADVVGAKPNEVFRNRARSITKVWGSFVSIRAVDVILGNVIVFIRPGVRLG